MNDYLLWTFILLPLGAVLAYAISRRLIPQPQGKSRRNMALVIFIFWALAVRAGLQMYMAQRTDFEALFAEHRLYQLWKKQAPEEHRSLQDYFQRALRQGQISDPETVRQVGEAYLSTLLLQRLKASSDAHFSRFMHILTEAMAESASCREEFIAGQGNLWRADFRQREALENLMAEVLQDAQPQPSRFSAAELEQTWTETRQQLAQSWPLLQAPTVAAWQDEAAQQEFCPMMIALYRHLNRPEQPRRLAVLRRLIQG